MLATVTNRAGGARGLSTLDRGIVLLDPASSAVLDLADHPLHRVWARCGDIVVLALSDKDAKAARKRLEAEAEVRTQAQAAALAGLATASPADLSGPPSAAS